MSLRGYRSRGVLLFMRILFMDNLGVIICSRFHSIYFGGGRTVWSWDRLKSLSYFWWKFHRFKFVDFVYLQFILISLYPIYWYLCPPSGHIPEGNHMSTQWLTRDQDNRLCRALFGVLVDPLLVRGYCTGMEGQYAFGTLLQYTIWEQSLLSPDPFYLFPLALFLNQNGFEFVYSFQVCCWFPVSS